MRAGFAMDFEGRLVFLTKRIELLNVTSVNILIEFMRCDSNEIVLYVFLSHS